MEEQVRRSSDSKIPGLDDNDDGANERTQSVADIMDLHGMTLFEKKCLLINREIDNMGMGKYQWCLWSLCGQPNHPEYLALNRLMIGQVLATFSICYGHRHLASSSAPYSRSLALDPERLATYPFAFPLD